MNDEKFDNKNKKIDQFEQFIEKTVTPAEGANTQSGFFGTNSLESEKILGQTYDKQKSLKLSKGMTILWLSIVLIFILSVVSLFLNSGIVNVIYADEDKITSYEIKVGLGKNVSIKNIKWIGSYDSSMVYKGYNGKVARLIKSVDWYSVYDAVIIVCSEEQILELIEARYVLPISQINTNYQEEYNELLGVESEGKYYGLATSGGVTIMGTKQQLQFDEAEYFAMALTADGGKSGKNVRRFLKLYFSGNE